MSEKYSKLKKTICINILDFDTLETSKYHSTFKIREDEENFVLTDLLEIHFLEMRKLHGYEAEDDLSQWINFIRADSKEVLKEMAEFNPKINKAVNVLETMCQDKKARAEYLSREMALHDEATRMEEALEEGREIGKKIGEEIGKEIGKEIGEEIGKEEKALEIARNLLDVLDDETIAIKTGLQVAVIKSLRLERLDT